MHDQPMPVDRCVCMGVAFERLHRLAAAGATLDDLRRRTGCGAGCGLCIPYIRAMLATGRTRFAVMSPADLAKLPPATA